MSLLLKHPLQLAVVAAAITTSSWLPPVSGAASGGSTAGVGAVDPGGNAAKDFVDDEVPMEAMNNNAGSNNDASGAAADSTPDSTKPDGAQTPEELQAALEEETKNAPVTELDASNFDATMEGWLSGGFHAIGMFHVDWCGICQRTKPVFKLSAQVDLRKGVVIMLPHVLRSSIRNYNAISQMIYSKYLKMSYSKINPKLPFSRQILHGRFDEREDAGGTLRATRLSVIPVLGSRLGSHRVRRRFFRRRFFRRRFLRRRFFTPITVNIQPRRAVFLA
jgi:hypothetical protein